jgi:hypothetical protein
MICSFANKFSIEICIVTQKSSSISLKNCYNCLYVIARTKIFLSSSFHQSSGHNGIALQSHAIHVTPERSIT